ncbi:hypothetical protein [Aureispira sp. CCB-E]|uniref:hypothetical protein n=1 Tax=Aureispira sp. CCB-E TaxID=3051121 RepID=UPI00286913DA|nr:hypothetical protein [Aureispira sp. CCB-E]WMX17273.1 hypothetical protein QP953_12910 [Aureispira sp. CCB-E]
MISLPEIQERYQEWSREREEPVLINYGKEAYRFSWSHTFGGAEVYRIEKKNNRYSATVKIYVSAFGTYEDSLVHSSEKWISEATWIEITEGLNENSFWTYPPTIERRGLDGAVWSLEGYNPTKNKCTRQNYHNIGRWSPIDSIFVSMCDLFMNLKER